MTDKPHMDNRFTWMRVLEGRSRKPADGVKVLLVVDRKVQEGFFNEYRNLWFVDTRPVFPSHWRPMPKLPRGLA